MKYAVMFTDQYGTNSLITDWQELVKVLDKHLIPEDWLKEDGRYKICHNRILYKEEDHKGTMVWKEVTKEKSWYVMKSPTQPLVVVVNRSFVSGMGRPSAIERHGYCVATVEDMGDQILSIFMEE